MALERKNNMLLSDLNIDITYTKFFLSLLAFEYQRHCSCYMYQSICWLFSMTNNALQ